MRVFISGGCKNGKSLHAQKIAKKMQKCGKPLYYIATMTPADGEDDCRIARHRKERDGWGFETIEAGREISAAIADCDCKGSFLLDSVTALLANEMFQRSDIVRHAYKKVTYELKKAVHEIENIVIVSDFIYSDAFRYDKLTEHYRYGLAYIDKEIAKISDIVLEACGGNLITYKGADVFEALYSG